MSFLQLAKSPVFIQGSSWAIENIIEIPMDSVTNDPVFSYINVFSLIFRMAVQLERLFIKKKERNSRKLGEDQLHIFHSLEKSLQRTGIDGKACMLRAICEMQKQSLNRYSVMGEIVTALLTPKRGPGNMMQEYLEAERVGQVDVTSCSSSYSACPVSLFNLLRTYSTPADKPGALNHYESTDPGAVEDDDGYPTLELNDYAPEADRKATKKQTSASDLELLAGDDLSESDMNDNANQNHLHN